MGRRGQPAAKPQQQKPTGSQGSSSARGNTRTATAEPTPNKAPQPHSTTELTERQLNRKLSFIDCSISQVKEAIVSEDPEWKFNTQFWHTVLVGRTAEEFRFLQNRTLAFWVNRFNRWQEMGEWQPRKAPTTLDGNRLAKMMGMPKDRMFDVMKLFDPAGYRTVQAEGDTEHSIKKSQINVRELMTTGVILSRLIPSRHKLKFVFGVMDIDDSRSLDVDEFAEFIRNYIHGMGAAFGIADDPKVLPCETNIATIASRLYSRISAVAGQRLRDLHAQGDANTKAALAEAIKAKRRGGVVKGNSPVHGGGRQVLKFSTLQDWCFRVFKDPLALPYALAIERFCPERYGEVVDGTDLCDSLSDWYLKHTGPVEVPEDIQAIEETGHILTRPEVIIARETFRWAEFRGKWVLSREDIETHMNTTMSDFLWDLISDALPQVGQQKKAKKKPDFFAFLRLLCPAADDRHLRMFEVWCQQYDDLAAKQKELEKAESLLTHTFEANDNKQRWPDSDIEEFKKLFAVIDTKGNGYVDAKQLGQGLELDHAAVLQLMHDNDVSDDGYIDEREFLRMMCPPNCKLPEMEEGSAERQLLGTILRTAIEREKTEFEHEDSKFRHEHSELGAMVAQMPDSALPEVDDDTWSAWNAMFDRLDTNNDDELKVKELQASGLVAPEVSEFLVEWLAAENSGGLTRNVMLTALLKAHNLKKRGFNYCLAQEPLAIETG